MNQQEIFDKVATHLIAQGKQSLSWIDTHLSCAYRGDEGAMCAAGCLIPDGEYDPVFEGMPWNCIWKEVPSFANASLEVHNLIGSLQEVHDCEAYWETPERLKEGLFDVADQYGLSADVLN